MVKKVRLPRWQCEVCNELHVSKSWAKDCEKLETKEFKFQTGQMVVDIRPPQVSDPMMIMISDHEIGTISKTRRRLKNDKHENIHFVDFYSPWGSFKYGMWLAEKDLSPTTGARGLVGEL